MVIGQEVLIKKTEQKAVIIDIKYKFRNWKFVECYQVMWQLPDMTMNILGYLHPDSLIV
ncbi:MAG: hypothetical protein ACYDD5_00505 [Sulfuricurvum sp.]